MFAKKTDRFLVDYLGPKRRIILMILTFFWSIALGLFWGFWFRQVDSVVLFGFIVNTFLILWTLLMPAYFFIFLLFIKVPNPDINLPSGKIAIVITKAPSEPISMLKKTLLAAKNQLIKADVWLADEHPTTEMIDFCEMNQINISTRFGVSDYHRENWPRRTKSKEGNLTYFYDHYGYQNYDFVAQLDADHVPTPNYLTEIMKAFADSKVGYVSAPSICSGNSEASWTARGRLYAEAALHGPLQAGYAGAGVAPLCIGSHYAVRTSALKQIGGLGPELAEDHSTTLLMQAHGWKGVHALDALAIGDGPLTFADAMTQEYQWSKSLVKLFLTLLPKHIGNLSWKLKVQFVFCQLWYVIYALVMFLGVLVAPLALLTGIAWANVNYFQFIFYTTPLTLISLLIMYAVKRWQLLRPADSKIVSWEFVMFQLTRWPFVIQGIIDAFVEISGKKSEHIIVTPKGKVKADFDFKLIFPYVVIVFSTLIIILLNHSKQNVAGYEYLALIQSIWYFIAIITIWWEYRVISKNSYAKS